MIDFNYDERDIRKSFNLSETDWELIKGLMTQLEQASKDGLVDTMRWLRRVWIDERLTDNAKVYMVFQTGRLYQAWLHDHDQDDPFEPTT